jgi:hypothetical protein
MSVAVAEQLRGDRVAVGLVVDQNAAEGVAGEWVEGLEKGAKIIIHGSDASERPLNPSWVSGRVRPVLRLATAPPATRSASKKSNVTASGPGRLEPVVGAAGGGVGVVVVDVAGLGFGCSIPRALSTVGA